MQATIERDEPSWRKRPIRRFLAAFALAFRFCERHRQRLYLSELDDHLLDDVGLTPADVRRECAKPFWR